MRSSASYLLSSFMVRGPNGLGTMTVWRDGIVGDVGFRTSGRFSPSPGLGLRLVVHYARAHTRQILRQDSERASRSKSFILCVSPQRRLSVRGLARQRAY